MRRLVTPIPLQSSLQSPLQSPLVWALVATVVGIVAAAPAQDFLLSRTSDTSVSGRPSAIRGKGAGRKLVFATKDVEIHVPWNEILALHGRSPKVSAPVAVYLAGGDELKGELRGGDDDGENFVLQSGALGSATVAVDRLQTLVFRVRAPAAILRDFAIPKDAPYHEALFGRARRGFDVFDGDIERFTPQGVEFVRTGRLRPRLFLYKVLTGISLREAAVAESPGDWLLVTSNGDRLRVSLTRITEAAMSFATEFGAVTLPHAQVSALTKLTGHRVFLSDLQPVRVEEIGSDASVAAPPLFTFRRDRTVSGGTLSKRRSPADGYLVVDGRTYAKGLGVHSRCILTFRVPAKAAFFHAKVAIDDEVKALGVKGDVDVLVRAGGKVLFHAEGLSRGQPPRTLGRLQVVPGSLLSLEVDFGKGMFLGDRVDWLSAVFLLQED